MKTLRFLIIVFILTIPLGQYSRLPLGSIEGAVYLSDLIAGLILLVFLFQILISKKSFKLPPFFLSIVVFILVALTTLFFAKQNLSLTEWATSSFYLLRWMAYTGLYFSVYSLIAVSESKEREVRLIVNLLILASLILGILGLVQFVLFPDFSKMVEHGWDPHYYRVLSTFFDPNYVGGFFVLSLVLILGLHFFEPEKKINWFHFITTGIIFVAVILTFSRSTYLMLIVSVGLLGLIKSRKLLLVGLLSFILAFLLIPRVQERIYGAIVNIDESAKARFTSWENGITIAKDNFLTGVGYNTYRYAQIRYGFIDSWDLEAGGRSGAGVDSSLLLILATTGIFGLLSYLGIFSVALIKSGRGIFANRLNLAKGLSLVIFCGLAGLMMHSFFVNSLLYPWIMSWVWIVLGLHSGLNR